MAKLKAELSHQAQLQGKTTLRDRFFANADAISSVANRLAPLPRYLKVLPGSGLLQEKLLGIARERELPTVRGESFEQWCQRHEPRVTPASARGKVLLFPDTFTNYSHPHVGRAAIRVLEAANIHVQLASNLTASGRAAYSKGFLEKARHRARTNVDALAPFLDDGWDLVVLEPSDAVMFQSDYLDLLGGDDVERVASRTYGICEYLDRFRLDADLPFSADASLVYHGHCHQTATSRDHHAVAVLRRAGFSVDVLDSGCCGMAGSFGYEAEHYAMSRAIGRVLEEQIADSSAEIPVTSGASCRSQLAHGCDDGWLTPTADTDQFAGESERDPAYPPHPIEVLAMALEP